MSTLVDHAIALAYAAHDGQVDKAGQPYVNHPARVSRRVRATAPGSKNAEIVAWLHDVVEDTPVTPQDITYRFGAVIAAAVDAITRRPGEQPDTYYRRVAKDPLALVVKLADIADNTDPERLAKLDHATRKRLEAKYAHALQVLRGPVDDQSGQAHLAGTDGDSSDG